ncbi:DUF1772 domain-containing protein [Streptomyces sp. TR06-5]|uniref:anthrone oxygenase family protein n=1 Tax=unclassified Streptomyces TaxID=2593676 RepID=UPI0039A22273
MWQGIALVGATLLTGVMAGLYFAFSIAVMPGLAACEDRTYVEAMRSVNDKILNAWFGLAFAGAPLLILVAGALHLDGDDTRLVFWTLAAFLLYALTLGITFRVNVPLNDHLDSDEVEPGEARARFQSRWVRWNHVRTVLSTAALGCLAWALVLHGHG